MKSLIEFLRQPYPVVEPPAYQLRRALLIGLFIGGFLLLFQPFGLNLWETDRKGLKIFGFGLITVLVTTAHFVGWPRLFPHWFEEEHWTTGRAIVFVLANVLLIGLANYLYLAWLLDMRVTGHNLLTIVLATFSVGVFPVVATVVATYVSQLKKYTRQAAELPQQGIATLPTITESADAVLDNATSAPAPPSVVTLIAENEKDTLTLDATSLLFLESSDNYCTVFFERSGHVEKPLLRSSLSRLLGQLPDNSVVRCHRSYAVNVARVERVTGNAQGYKLHLAVAPLHGGSSHGGQYVVPVARQYNDTLVAQLKSR